MGNRIGQPNKQEVTVQVDMVNDRRVCLCGHGYFKMVYVVAIKKSPIVGQGDLVANRPTFVCDKCGEDLMKSKNVKDK